MSERTWGEGESAPPPKKKGIPAWLWFCGGGCLLAVILAIAGGAWLFSKVKDAKDPEKQWPNVTAILPFDERPPELTLTFGFNIGVGMYMFTDSRGYIAVLTHMDTGGDSDRKQFMDPESELGVMGKRKDAKASKLTVQGRELDVLRFQHIGGSNSGSSQGMPQVDSGTAVLVDLTQVDQTGFLILQLVRTESSEEIGNEDIIRFLKPFHVGPNR